MRIILIAAVVLAGLLTCRTARAQDKFRPGYVVLTRGDTLRGLVRVPTRNTVARGVVFRKILLATDQVFHPVASLRAVSLTGGKSYVMRKMLPVMRRDTLRLLLEPLMQGRANLYRSSYSFRNSPDDVYLNEFSSLYYYVEAAANPARPPYLLQLNTFRKDLNSLFSDCPSAPAVTGKFSEENLVRLVREYNACPAPLTQAR